MGEYQCLVQATIDMDPIHLEVDPLYEVFLQLNQLQDGRLAGTDEVLWARAQAFHFRNLLALSRKVASRCTSGLRLPAAVQTVASSSGSRDLCLPQRTPNPLAPRRPWSASPVAPRCSRLGIALPVTNPSLPNKSGHSMGCQLLLGLKLHSSPAAKRSQC